MSCVLSRACRVPGWSPAAGVWPCACPCVWAGPRRVPGVPPAGGRAAGTGTRVQPGCRERASETRHSPECRVQRALRLTPRATGRRRGGAMKAKRFRQRSEHATCTFRAEVLYRVPWRYGTVYRVGVRTVKRERASLLMGRRSLRALTLYLTSQYLTLARIANTPNRPRPSKGALPCCPFMPGFRRREGGRAGLCVGRGGVGVLGGDP